MTKEEDRDAGKTSVTRFYTDQGYPMKDELICYSSLSTGYVTVCKGADAKAAADSITTVVLDLAGYGSIAAAMINTAFTVCRAYSEATGTSAVTGCYGDYIQVKINYDICTKYTWADLGYGDGYRLGAVTQQIRLIDISVLQYYADRSGGRERSARMELDKTYETKNYRNPAGVAAANIYAPWVERICAWIYHHPIVF